MPPSLARTSKDLIGTTLAGRYKIIQTLSAGGMGVVYAARHVWTKREVAVKLVRPDLLSDDSVTARFLREAQSAAQLKHPNVVDVLDMGRTEEGLVFMALEMLEGETLQQRMRRSAMGVEETIQLLEPILDALVYIHERQMVHRDIKPSNIFLATTPRRGVVPKLLDFGLVKILDDAKTATSHPGLGSVRQEVTKVGHLLGTPLYSAPEQVRAEPNIGPSADVWSVGVVLYEALTGQRPYQASDPIIAISAIASRPPTPILEVDPSVPPRVAAWIDRALSHDQASRPTMAELQAGLLQAVGAAEVPRQAAPNEEEEPPTVPTLMHPGRQSLVQAVGAAEVPRQAAPSEEEEPPTVPTLVHPGRQGLEAEEDVSGATTLTPGTRDTRIGGEPARLPSDHPTLYDGPATVELGIGGRRRWGLTLAVLLALSVALALVVRSSTTSSEGAVAHEPTLEPSEDVEEPPVAELAPAPVEQVREPSPEPVADATPEPVEEPSAGGGASPTPEAARDARGRAPDRASRRVREAASNPLEFGL